MRTHPQDRLIAAAGAGIVVALLGWLLVFGLDVRMLPETDAAITLLALHPPPPPPPPAAPIERRRARATKAPSPRNLRNQATQVVAPPPIVIPPTPPPVVVAPRAGAGDAPSAGASDRPGPGQGAGGFGNGEGGDGGGGDGDGDGGDTPPRQVRGRLHYSDLPAALRERGAAGTVDVRYTVGIDGRVTGCHATRSSGDAQLDDATCRLIERQFRFETARDGDGVPFPSNIVESHSWFVDREGYDAPGH